MTVYADEPLSSGEDNYDPGNCIHPDTDSEEENPAKISL